MHRANVRLVTHHKMTRLLPLMRHSGRGHRANHLARTTTGRRCRGRVASSDRPITHTSPSTNAAKRSSLSALSRFIAVTNVPAGDPRLDLCGPQSSARCSLGYSPSLNSTCGRHTACKQARVACRRAWMVERPSRRQSSPSCSDFDRLPEVALVVSSVVSHSWKFDDRSATDTIASGSPASTRPDRREGELP